MGFFVDEPFQLCLSERVDPPFKVHESDSRNSIRLEIH